MNRQSNKLTSLKRGIAVLSPSCKEATRLQSLALDQPLTGAQRLGLRMHLFLCKWCRRYGSQLRFLRAAAQRPEAEEKTLSPQTLQPAARERIKRKLQETEK